MSIGRDGDGDAVGALLARLAQLEAEKDRADAQIEAYKRELMARADLTQLLAANPAADGTGPIARVQGHRAPAHRTPPDRRWLKVVPGLVPLAAFVRHPVSWVANHAAASAAGAATIAAPVALGVALTVTSPAAGAHQAHRAASFPAVSLWTATPVTPSPGVAAGKAKADAATAHPAAIPAPQYPYATIPARGSTPPRSPSPQAAAMQGTLDVTEVTVTLQPGTVLGEFTGQLDLTAAGGPVTWSAAAPGLSLDTSGGTIRAGQTVVVQVAVPIGQLGGSGTVTLQPGDVSVAVSWLPGLPGALPSSLGL